MQDLVRQEIATAADSMVVKVGTRVLTGSDGRLNQDRVASLAEELHDVIQDGRKVALVSSGAVGAGMGQLGLDRRPTDLARLQAVAAVGQAHLVEAYDRALTQHGHHAAQVLLTAADLEDRACYLNVRNTLVTLMEYGAIPIINENDTVAVDELLNTFGDNDRLAALVTHLLRAPLLVLLTDVAGLYDGDPDDPASQVIPIVTQIDEATLGLVRTSGSGLGKGGMASKLEAARIATSAGENVILADGRTPGTLARILAGEPVGTLFLAHGRNVPLRKRWIAFSVQPRGRLFVDDGAKRAVTRRGGSLLPIGVVSSDGDFRKGDVVALCDAEGHEFARGLTNYAQDEVQKILGLHSDQMAAALSHCPYDEVIHRDNLAMLD